MEKNMSIDCWDYLQCNHSVRQECKAYETRQGKKCWLVTGTKCRGQVQVDLTTKILLCRECNFFKMRGGISG